MKEIKAPSTIDDYDQYSDSLFVAGGISNCPNWQKEFVQSLKHTDIKFYNPRRDTYAETFQKSQELEQISWEHENLKKCVAISFWFPKETLCPITLFEYGYWLHSDKQIFLGIHPEYLRKADLEIQTELSQKNIQIVYSLENLANIVESYFGH